MVLFEYYYRRGHMTYHSLFNMAPLCVSLSDEEQVCRKLHTLLDAEFGSVRNVNCFLRCWYSEIPYSAVWNVGKVLQKAISPQHLFIIKHIHVQYMNLDNAAKRKNRIHMTEQWPELLSAWERVSFHATTDSNNNSGITFITVNFRSCSGRL